MAAAIFLVLAAGGLILKLAREADALHLLMVAMGLLGCLVAVVVAVVDLCQHLLPAQVVMAVLAL